MGKAHEQDIINSLNNSSVTWKGLPIQSWVPATDEEDRIDKVDAWAHTEDHTYSVQIKHRESGSNVGLEVVRPYYPEGFLKQYGKDNLGWGRDVNRLADIYVVRANHIIYIMDGNHLKHICFSMIARLAAAGGMEREFSHHDFPGVQLKVVEDKSPNRGGGQLKIICYVNPIGNGALVLRGS